MNRNIFVSLISILLCASSHCFAQNMGEPFVFDNGDGQTMPYRLLGPATTNDGQTYPLIVFLHGSGERGTGNSIQMRSHIAGIRDATQTDTFASYLVAPQLPSGGTFWSADQPYDLTMDIIESIQTDFPIDSSRIYITGLSLGGFGTMNYLADFPDTFAAGVPMSGGGNTFAADVVKDVPTWFFHGSSDGAVSVEASREMADAMSAAGGVPLLSEVQGGGHVIWAPIYSDWESENYGLYSWMFDRRNSDSAASTLLPFESDWRYLDDGSDQSTQWIVQDFDDSSWKTGAGEFGYGDDDENTLVNCGADPRCRTGAIATTYFRTNFEVEDPTAIVSLEGQVLRSAAAAIYVNGQEVYRDEGITPTAPFDEYARRGLRNSSAAVVLDPAILVSGENLIAVELHKRDRRRDLSFDMRLAVRSIPEPSSHDLAVAILFCCMRVARQRQPRPAEGSNAPS